MKNLFFSLPLAAVLLASCQKEILKDKPLEAGDASFVTMGSNPALTFRHQDHYVTSSLPVPAIYVANADGTNPAVVYLNYKKKNGVTTLNRPDHPTWSNNGQKICFVLNDTDLYTINVSVVNGVPTGTNALKIANGVSRGGRFFKPAWQPGDIQIASVFSNGVDAPTIRLIPSSGGTQTTLYKSPTGYTLISRAFGGASEAHLTFNGDGSKLAFIEQEVATGASRLRVLDVASKAIAQDVALPLAYYSFLGIDWSNTQANVLAFSARPDPCKVSTAATAALYTIDLGASNAAPAIIFNDVEDCSWSPDDTRIAVSRFSQAVLGGSCAGGLRYYKGAVDAIDMSTQARIYLYNYTTSLRYNPDWKK
jgi:Tol biopolymer transport system component